MTDIKELICTIVKPLVSYPDDIAIQVSESDEFHEYNLSVHSDDVGRIIGKKGRIAKAIRTIVYSVRTEDNKRVRLTIEDK
ncbi:KH domain-containing protein [Lacticigenium naphthae]|uniref:KH domain-containing protein n=1 Tax=Lacticigenium naphthae TaxID=515351 RepID=UPI00048379F7|nr:KH domain-containing protein [Lacticigenium naphthae]